MKEFLKKIYRRLISFIKKLDRLTSYKVGDVARRLTNVNTPQYWDRYLGNKGDSWRSFPYEFLLSELPKDKPFTLLDIGCALGDGCEFLKKYFEKGVFFGADLSAKGVAKAREKSRCEGYFCLDIARQDPPQKYDYISLIHILEHFDDPFPIIDKCLKFVNNAVYISTPYGEKFDNPRLYWKGEHRYLFDEKTFDNYHCTVLKITERIEVVGTKYILYKIVP